MYYVYILRSIPYPNKTYTGHTINLKHRLTEHNSGECVHTNKFIPWQLCTYIAFDKKEKALVFEKYLKSGSGRAFAKKRF